MHHELCAARRINEAHLLAVQGFRFFLGWLGDLCRLDWLDVEFLGGFRFRLLDSSERAKVKRIVSSFQIGSNHREVAEPFL